MIYSVARSAILASALIFGNCVAEEAPLAPGLVKSHWPIAHASTWNSDYTSNHGPTTKSNSVELFINGDTIADINSILETADPITLVQSNVTGYAWGSSVSSVFQIYTDANGIKLVNSYYRDINFEYHGAYCLLAADGTYYAASRTSVQAYNNKVPFDFTSEIILTGEYIVEGLDDDEHLVGLTMSHDPVDKAFLMFATSRGHVGGVSLDLKKGSNLALIPGGDTVEDPSHFVSNSIAMDGTSGGIYVCTSKSMNRLKWNPDTQTIALDWSTDYGDGYDEWYWGRLGPGCGTSPTIVGPVNQQPQFVVITDGENPMNIRFYDVFTGKEVGKKTVSFGQTGEFNSTTDQSIVVKGYNAVVVNNWVADTVTPLCSEWFASLDVTDALKHECPFLFGAYVNGIEQFAIDPNTYAVTSVWANQDVSCTSSIPVVTDDNILYCLGKRVTNKVTGMTKYTIEAVDWNSGKSLFHVELSHSLLSNALYAATEVGTANDIVMGTLGGLLRVATCDNCSGEMKLSDFNFKQPASDAAWSTKKILDMLQDMYEKGTVPPKDFLQKMKK